MQIKIKVLKRTDTRNLVHNEIMSFLIKMWTSEK